MEVINSLKDIGVFAIASFFIQRIIINASNKRLEEHKQQLGFTTKSYQLTLDSDLEKFKSELRLQASKQTSLHYKRLMIIDQIYVKLVDLDSAMQEMTREAHLVNEDAEKEELERVKKAQEAFSAFNNYFLYHQLYFDKATSTLLDTVRKEYYSANFDYFEPKRLRNFTGGRPSPDGLREAIDRSHNAGNRVRNEIPKILEKLEDEFRTLLGVS
jgi:hypothetical protein